MPETIEARTMTVEKLQEMERRIQLEGDAHPDKVKLPDGRTLAELREGQAKQAVKDRQAARDFDTRSAEANRALAAKVEVRVTPSGVISASPIAPKSPQSLTDEEEIAARGEAVMEREAEAVVRDVVNPVGMVETKGAKR